MFDVHVTRTEDEPLGISLTGCRCSGIRPGGLADRAGLQLGHYVIRCVCMCVCVYVCMCVSMCT